MKSAKSAILAVVIAAVVATAAFAGETKWPERPVEFVVPANPGGDSDINCRVFLKYLEKDSASPWSSSTWPALAAPSA